MRAQLEKELVAPEEVEPALVLTQAQGLHLALVLATRMMKRMLQILTQVPQHQILEQDVECFVVKLLHEKASMSTKRLAQGTPKMPEWIYISDTQRSYRTMFDLLTLSVKKHYSK